MDKGQIEQLINNDFFVEKYGRAKLVETHISWVVLATDFVFKIKKPHLFTFLDFSTIEKRAFYCNRELELNRRLAPQMYLDVVPVNAHNGLIRVEGYQGTTIDHAVKMKRMDDSRQMNLLLEKGEVERGHLLALAKIMAGFHKKNTATLPLPDVAAMQQDFADLSSIKNFVGEKIGTQEAGIIESAIEHSAAFLPVHTTRILERHRIGFTVDGHGDLYSQNIFLPLDGPPVVFDCIEFSDRLRHLDVLNELAFFCMDLDYYDATPLADVFMEKYNAEHPCIFGKADEELFRYYKLYRANVRAKVGALKAMQISDTVLLEKQLAFVRAYLGLMEGYLRWDGA